MAFSNSSEVDAFQTISTASTTGNDTVDSDPNNEHSEEKRHAQHALYSWSTSVDSIRPANSRHSHSQHQVSEVCRESLASWAFLPDPGISQLSVAVESSSKPWLTALFDQPWHYAGSLGNIAECPFQTCLAGSGRRDSFTFASLCIIPQCRATDLASPHFVTTLATAFGVPHHNVSKHHENSQTNSSEPSGFSVPFYDDGLVLFPPSYDAYDEFSSSMMRYEYVTLVHQIQTMNRFLQTGWTCGDFVVPWTWQYTIPFLGATGLFFLCSLYATLTISSASKSCPRDDPGSHRCLPVSERQRTSSLSSSKDESGQVDNEPQVSPLETERLFSFDDVIPKAWQREAAETLPNRPPSTNPTVTTDSMSDDAHITDETQVLLPDEYDDENRGFVVSDKMDNQITSESHLLLNKRPKRLDDLYSDLARVSGATGCQSFAESASCGAPLNIWHEILSCFDLRRHSRFIWSQGAQSRNTACLDGLRVLSLLWIMLGHTMGIVSSTGAGYSNPIDFLPPTGMTTTLQGQLLFSSRFAVDTFLFLSGLLVVYTLQHKTPPPSTSAGWTRAVLTRYFQQLPFLLIHRIVRVLPLYLTVLGFYTQIAPHLGHGPFWYQWISLLQPCHDYGWTNVLFVNNFFPWNLSTTETCLYHTWYLAVDMQLFLVAPFLVFWYQFNPIHGRRMVSVLWVISVGATLYFSWTRHWSINTFDGAAVARFDVEAYAKPHFRSQSYLVGMYLAMALPESQLSHMRLWNRWNTMALFAAVVSMILVAFGTVAGAYARRPCRYQEWPGLDQCGSTWSPTTTFLYTSLSRTIWTLSVACVTYTGMSNHTGEGGSHLVSMMLRWSGWTPFSRLTFAAYLIHPVVIFVWQLGSEEKVEFRMLTFIMSYLSVCVVTYAAALVSVLVVELPCSALWKLYVARMPRQSAMEPQSSSVHGLRPALITSEMPSVCKERYGAFGEVSSPQATPRG
jgi:peptidoglycan/LPS O-acetylase OafA/YrhL